MLLLKFSINRWNCVRDHHERLEKDLEGYQEEYPGEQGAYSGNDERELRR